ncbi:MAG: HlyD family efflux transporter periplasmic adaptor subunit [Paracoccaceae bacterium]
MRFLTRSLIGLLLFTGAIAAVALGGWRVAEVMEAKTERGDDGGAVTERVFTVGTARIAQGEERPTINAYGEIRSWRTLELRADAAGRLVFLSDKFRDGEIVAAGDLLFRVDPEEYEAGVADAEAGLREAEADLAEAEQAVEVARQEERAAETQRSLRETGADRKRTLLKRGVSTTAEVEEADMMLAAAAQVVASRAQALIAAEIRIDRMAIRRDRAAIALEDARRALADTTYRAPFDGLVSGVTAVLGGLLAQNERLGELIDPRTLEAVFRVTNAQFARLLGPDGRLSRAPVSATLALDDIPLTAPGVIERAGSVIGEGQTGRLVYARLELGAAALLRPGDFVSVTVEEPALYDVARVPASAVTEAGEMLLIDGEDRLRPLMVEILRRQGDEMIIAGAPEGALYVSMRAPQLGPGVRVRSLGEPEPEADDGETSNDLVEIAPDRQRRLITFVEAEEPMTADARDRLLATLRSGKAPEAMLKRLEARMGRAG